MVISRQGIFRGTINHIFYGQNILSLSLSLIFYVYGKKKKPYSKKKPTSKKKKTKTKYLFTGMMVSLKMKNGQKFGLLKFKKKIPTPNRKRKKEVYDRV